MSYRRHYRYSKNNATGAIKPPFASFNPHDYEAPVLRNENLIITSIDPGIVNCGLYINCINTKDFSQKSILLTKLEFNKGENHYVESLKKFTELEEKHKYFSSSHYIVIESQMAISYDNTRMGQHLISFFMTYLKNKGNRPLIIEFNSQSKTRLLGCPKGLKKPEYKKWCKEKAVDLLKSRGKSEEKFADFLEKAKKKDDLGDAICQCEAWLIVYKGESVVIPKPVVREKEE
jgi:hypothetical protein